MILLPCFFVGWNCATPKKKQNLIWIHHSSNVSSSSQLCLSSWPPTEFHGFHCLPKTELTSSSLLTHSFTHWLTHSLAVGVIYQAAIPIVLIPLSPEKLLWQDLHDFHKLLGWIGIWHSYLQSKDEFPDLHLPLQLQSFRKETKHLPRSYFSRYELLVLGRGFEVYCTFLLWLHWCLWWIPGGFNFQPISSQYLSNWTSSQDRVETKNIWNHQVE